MYEKGAKRIFFKALSNNDNSKQQIYLGSDFDVLKMIPSGDTFSDGVSKKGPIFKAFLNFKWIDDCGDVEVAPNTKLILYPKYPEIRLSGFLAKTNPKLNITPRHLMKPPTREERESRTGLTRYLILGVNDTEVYAFCTEWGDNISQEIETMANQNAPVNVASVFYEFTCEKAENEDILMRKLKDIYESGYIESCRLDKHGNYKQYKAQNGAGYTLEAQFGITPNGNSEPDFNEWELKAHSGSVVTLMTPEPSNGTYIENGLYDFLERYATRKQETRLDFASIHRVNLQNEKTKLSLTIEGYDQEKGEIIDPDGGVMLRDHLGNLAAGWQFSKIIDHWKRKHSHTCFVSYTSLKEKGQVPKYQFGPLITLGKDTSLIHFVESLCKNIIYYDPGINMKLEYSTKYPQGRWIPKKRNQFRVKWKDIPSLYNNITEIDLREL